MLTAWDSERQTWVVIEDTRAKQARPMATKRRPWYVRVKAFIHFLASLKGLFR